MRAESSQFIIVPYIQYMYITWLFISTRFCGEKPEKSSLFRTPWSDPGTTGGRCVTRANAVSTHSKGLELRDLTSLEVELTQGLKI